MRRRQRRLRSWLRHERMTVAMALAEYTHHASPGTEEGQGGRGGPQGQARRQKLPPPQGSRPPCLGCGGHRWVCSGTTWSTWQTAAPSCRFSMLLCRSRGISCSRCSVSWTRRWQSRRSLPKISLDRIRQRLVELRLPQVVEQLVEVPTVLSPSLRFAEQVVDNPVSRGRGRRLQGLLPGQSSSPSAEQTVDIPVPRREGSSSGGLHGFSQNRIQQRRWPSSSLTVFRVYSQDRVRSAMLSSSLTFQFPVKVLIMEIFQVDTQDKVQQLDVEL